MGFETTDMKNAFLNWSSGKDAAMALEIVQKSTSMKVVELFTTISKAHQRVSMHGLRLELLRAQANALGLPLKLLQLEDQINLKNYGDAISKVLDSYKSNGISDSVFGDIFLEDLRAYREEQSARYGVKCHFPLWQKDTKTLIRSFVEKGYEAIVIAADADLFDANFVGSCIDKNWLDHLPRGVDPCGEHGEFHTFCFNGPLFSKKVGFHLGEKVKRSYPFVDKDKNRTEKSFWFMDLYI